MSMNRLTLRLARRWRVGTAIALVCLNALGVYSRPDRRKREAEPRHLYQVTSRDKLSGEKKSGFIDATGKLVIGFERLPKGTVAVGDFHDGRARIYVRTSADETKGNINAAVGFIDQTGKMIIEPRFETARDFSEGLAFVEAKDFQGFIDRFGKVVIKVSFKFTKDFHDGLAAVGMSDREPNNHDWGYIDRSGKLVIKQQYSFADDFSEGLAGVVVDRKYGFIDKRGEMIIPPQFDLRREQRHPNRPVSSGRFVAGLACVRVGEFYGFVNRTGAFAIRPQFSHAQEFAEGLAWVTTDGNRGVVNRVGWIDKTGRWVVTAVDGRSLTSGLRELFNYANAYEDWRYSEGLAPLLVYDGDKFLRGYMNQQGKAVIKPRDFEKAGRFVGGVAEVVFHGNSSSAEDYGYIDKQGRLIWRSK